ncbi:unnamed protein product, partial [Ilex paraguariensis]
IEEAERGKDVELGAGGVRGTPMWSHVLQLRGFLKGCDRDTWQRAYRNLWFR